MVTRVDSSDSDRELPKDNYSPELPMILDRAIATDGVKGLSFIF
ncbi:hypothetical protein V2H45_24235 [Tumidithrix elongata RA019]|uniref:Uncharacterized protein n=1 Tax=Tumidithrix elongata BACA0141 TaxID=2716417 RepID=A0AAW9Q6P5_9CYAN|nr:hypothetical protein [Tumidithrix elongata RA019]